MLVFHPRAPNPNKTGSSISSNRCFSVFGSLSCSHHLKIYIPPREIPTKLVIVSHISHIMVYIIYNIYIYIPYLHFWFQKKPRHLSPTVFRTCNCCRNASKLGASCRAALRKACSRYLGGLGEPWGDGYSLTVELRKKNKQTLLFDGWLKSG